VNEDIIVVITHHYARVVDSKSLIATAGAWKINSAEITIGVLKSAHRVAGRGCLYLPTITPKSFMPEATVKGGDPAALGSSIVLKVYDCAPADDA
jgi:hypothetical protein